MELGVRGETGEIVQSRAQAEGSQGQEFATTQNRQMVDWTAPAVPATLNIAIHTTVRRYPQGRINR